MANGAMTKAERELETKEQSDARRRANEKARKLQVKEMMGAAVIGLALGAIDARMPSLLTGFGPGNYLTLDWVLAGGGLYLAFKGKNGAREYGSAAAVIGIANLVRPYGSKLASGFGA
jgi:hypothetical protein